MRLERGVIDILKEPKRKHGRPLKDGAKRRRVEIRVSDDFYDELKELCSLEGETLVDYITESVKMRGSLTRVRHANSDENEDYTEYEDEYYDDYDE